MFEIDPLSAIEALRHSPWAVMITRRGRIAWFNASFAEMFRLAPQAPLDQEAESSLLAALAPAFDGDTGHLELPGDDGEIRHLRCWRRPLGDGDGFYLEDITEQQRWYKKCRQLEELVRTLADKDPETGLLNKNAILAALDGQISRSRRYGNPLSTIHITLVPPPGGEVAPASIKQISQEFNASLRWPDLIGRLDAASFILVLPETTLADAEVLASKLKHDRLALGSCGAGCTTAVSVAAWRKGEDSRKLLDRLLAESCTRSAAP